MAPLFLYPANVPGRDSERTSEGGVRWPPLRPRARGTRRVRVGGRGSPGGGSPRGREEGPVDGAEAGQAHEDRDDPGHDAQVVGPEVLGRRGV